MGNRFKNRRALNSNCERLSFQLKKVWGMTDYNTIYFKRTSNYVDNEITLDSTSLQVLVCIDEQKPVGIIADELDISVVKLRDILKKLFKIRLIERMDINTEYMDFRFAQNVQEQLIELTGPLGTMLFDDAMESFRCTPETIPKEKAKDLIYAIAKEIPDEEESEKFVSFMIDTFSKFI